MSADELRQAAETLRERAEDANPAPWTNDRNAVRTGYSALALTYDIRFGNDTDQTGKDAAYIATMHPGVGLALADWLDEAAESRQQAEDLLGTTRFATSKDARPLALARLINGGAS